MHATSTSYMCKYKIDFPFLSVAVRLFKVTFAGNAEV